MSATLPPKLLQPIMSGEVVARNPTHIWIEPTNRCNTRCTHCAHFYEQFGEDMDHDLYHKIRDQVLDGVERVELIGYGEPFMAKHFDEMFEECSRRGLEIYTTSNGILLRKDEKVEKLVRSNLTLCISVDGARPETYETVRPYIKFHKFLETLECIKRCADAAGEEKRFRLRFNFCAMKQNIGDLPDLVRLAHKYGAYQILVLPLAGEELLAKLTGQSLHDSPELVSPAYLEALRVAEKVGVELLIPESFRHLILEGAERRRGVKGRVLYFRRRAELAAMSGRRLGAAGILGRLRRGGPPVKAPAGVTYCNMPWNDAYFASNGTVFPCCIMGEKLGDMKQQSWEEIWNGQAYRNLRRTVHSWNPSAVCRTCGLPTGINGGDGKAYDKFFARYKAEVIPLDDPRVRFANGFHELEKKENGAPSHIWMAKAGSLIIDVPANAKFLRITILPRTPVWELNPGKARIANREEPFDTSCPQLHFPLKDVKGTKAEIRFEMENVHRIGEDVRDLAIAITGLQILT